ncbi:MAG: DUF1176 domain-containing protein [Zoogloeaceae bacterium]|jgi:hypothetical protein|nr:DUF1176 domain-containing protein [Zoogloeaceae bacterium]
MRQLPLICLFFAIVLPCLAAEPIGVNFYHEDWSLVCDNTRACRATGYQIDGERPVSVLLTRKAGPSQPVTARLNVVSTEEDEDWLRLRINGHDLGALAPLRDELFSLNKAQTNALLRALVRDSEILVVGRHDQQWELSDKGAAAVLLKMDEFQGRLGTPGALIRKGQRDESTVLAPLPVPVVRVPPIPALRAGDANVAKDSTLRDALRKTTDDDECPSLDSQSVLDIVARLGKDKLLVSALCWRAAYNEGYGYWIINAKTPWQPVLVTTSATDYTEGRLSATQKGRGLGDCWGNSEWSWDGKSFIKTGESNAGLCKGFVGGAWDLPSVVSRVIHTPR